MADRPYLSIGEVLSLLKEEFPDITISKIRFLESQGLLDPERTPSGYRKFYDADVDRLRWILRQQREHYLPLKVIKGRLGPGEVVEDDDDNDPDDPHPVSATHPANGDAVDDDVAETPVEARPAPQPVLRAVRRPQPAATSRPTTPAPVAVPERPAVASPPTPAAAADNDGEWPAESVSLTFDELAAEVGLTDSRLAELERYGLVVGKPVGGTPYYDDEAVGIARLAARFLHFGVEARHLKMYKSSAEREAGLFEQIIVPMLKQRNPEARRRAMEAVVELSRLGEGLREAMLRQALKDYTAK